MRIIILGPTAVGKTALSLKLAKEYRSPIVSVDSRQCYQYLNIGTATPTLQELSKAKHYNISILSPRESDNVSQFIDRVKQWELEIKQQGINDYIFAGGSTLHLQSLFKPLDDVPKSNAENISELEDTLEKKGVEYLYHWLEKVDPDYAQRMDGFNTQRILRALDVYMQTGKAFSSFHTNWNEFSLPEDTILIGLHRPRQQLYERINKRVHKMIDRGLVKEVQAILDYGFDPTLQSLNTVGYKQIINYLNKKCSLDEAIKDIQTKTRHYAKRQLTWFRRWPFIHWLDCDQLTNDQMLEEVKKLVAAKKNNR